MIPCHALESVPAVIDSVVFEDSLKGWGSRPSMRFMDRAGSVNLDIRARVGIRLRTNI